MKKIVTLNNLLSNISDKTYKTKNSLTMEVMKSIVDEINLFYENLDLLADELFGDTQSLENLEKRILERGLTKKLATNSYFSLKCDAKVNIGERFSSKELTYIVTEHINNYTYKVMCEQKGTYGNFYLGRATPINYIENLTSSVIEELLIPARDDEDVESLRTRYFESFGIQPYGGNKKDYYRIIEQIEGVYSAKVRRAGKGRGTSEIYILDAELKKPKDELLAHVKEILDPIEYEGYGYGLLPIGHKAYILPCNENLIDIEIEVAIEPKYKPTPQNIDEFNAQIINEIIYSIENYFEVLKKGWHKQVFEVVVRLSYLTDYVLKNKKINDVFNIKINGESKNFELKMYDIPVLNNVKVKIKEE